MIGRAAITNKSDHAKVRWNQLTLAGQPMARWILLPGYPSTKRTSQVGVTGGEVPRLNAGGRLLQRTRNRYRGACNT
jgi:hypothetical protein